MKPTKNRRDKRVLKRYFNRKAFNASGPNVASLAHLNPIKRFLEQVERLESKVLTDLKGIAQDPHVTEVLSEAYHLSPGIYIDATGRILGPWSPWDNLNTSNHPHHIRFKSELLKWAHKWHLIDDEGSQPFYLEVGIEAIRRYRDEIDDLDAQGYRPGDIDMFGRKIEEPKLSLSESLIFQDELPDTFFHEHFPFSFNPSVMSTQEPSLLESYESATDNGIYGLHLGWDPRSVDGGWVAFDKQMRKLFDAYMAAYKARTMAFLEANSYEPITGETETDLAFEYFVHFQVIGKDYDEIARHYEEQDPTGRKEVETEDVRKFVAKVAELVKLPRRQR